MAVLPLSCIPGLTKQGRLYQLYLALGGQEDACFGGLTYIEQLRLVLALVGSEECIFTEQDFYTAWLEFLSPGACVGMPLEELVQAVYALLYAEAGDPSLTPPECFLGLPPEQQDEALIAAIINSTDALMFDLTELTISGAGNTNLSPPSSLLRTVLVPVPSGEYTKTLSLLTTGAKENSRFHIYLHREGASNITVQIFDKSPSETQLFEFPGTSASAEVEACFVFDGTQWLKCAPNVIFSDEPAPASLLDDLYGYWAFSDLTDATANGRNLAQVAGTTTFVPGKHDNAANFAGNSSVGRAAIGSTTALTVAAWVKTSASGAGAIIGNFNGGAAIQAFRLVTIDNLAVFQIQNGVSDAFNASGAFANDGNWQYLVGTWDGTTVKIYINGVLQATTAETNVSSISNSTSWVVGVALDGGFGTAVVDEMAIWSRALPQSSVTALYNGGTGLFYEDF
jgi:hypothetical protein